jgi:hypothetical protein
VANVGLAQKSFRMHSVDLHYDFGHVESRFNPLVTVVVLVQDKCMVCAKAQKSFWMHPIVLLGDEA